MRHLILSSCVFAFAASCSFPQYTARRTIENALPADGIGELHCTSHNGGITITGKPGTSEIRWRVEMTVRGHTQEEADANLAQLSVSREAQNGCITLAGKYERSLSGMSPSFTFVLEGPPELVARLISHNGDLRAEGTNGVLMATTHNGNIAAQSGANVVKLHTHNGDVELELDGAGSVDGKITSHNGNVVLALGTGKSVTIDASTYNGRVTLERSATNVSQGKRHLECRTGDGSGQLELQTHNGNVVIR